VADDVALDPVRGSEIDAKPSCALIFRRGPKRRGSAIDGALGVASRASSLHRRRAGQDEVERQAVRLVVEVEVMIRAHELDLAREALLELSRDLDDSVRPHLAPDLDLVGEEERRALVPPSELPQKR